MSWTRHLYDPVGAIARDSGLLGRNRRPMTEAERLRQRTLGTRRFGADDGPVHGGAGRGAAEREVEPLMVQRDDVPMAKPAPVADPTKGVAPAGKAQGVSHGSGLALMPNANPGVTATAAQPAAAAGIRQPGPPVGPLPGQPGNAHTARIAAGLVPQEPLMTDRGLGRFTRRGRGP